MFQKLNKDPHIIRLYFVLRIRGRTGSCPSFVSSRLPPFVSTSGSKHDAMQTGEVNKEREIRLVRPTGVELTIVYLETFLCQVN